jgi:hypothetical protein
VLNHIPSAGLGSSTSPTRPARPTSRSPSSCTFSFTDDASANFAVKVHKSTGPGIDYQSVGHNEHLADPTKQPTANCRQSDNQENRASAAPRSARRSAGARRAPVGSCSRSRDEVTPAGTAALAQLSTALDAANPSAPLIPLIVEGFASAEGPGDYNKDRSDRRATDLLDRIRIPTPV